MSHWQGTISDRWTEKLFARYDNEKDGQGVGVVMCDTPPPSLEVAPGEPSFPLRKCCQLSTPNACLLFFQSSAG